MRNGKLLMAVMMSLLWLCMSMLEPTVVAAVGDEKPVTLQLGHNSHAESFTGKALVEWAKQLSEKTSGKLKIEIFPQNQMGSNKELSEQTALGSLDINVQGMNALVDYKVEEGISQKCLSFLRIQIMHTAGGPVQMEWPSSRRLKPRESKSLGLALIECRASSPPSPSRSNHPRT